MQSAEATGRQDRVRGVKRGSPLQKQGKVSKAVVLTRTGPEPRNQTRDEAEGLAGSSRTERSGVAALHKPGNRGPRGRRSRLCIISSMAQGKDRGPGVRRPGFRSRLSYLRDEWCRLSNVTLDSLRFFS